jgi:hypothetical protein
MHLYSCSEVEAYISGKIQMQQPAGINPRGGAQGKLPSQTNELPPPQDSSMILKKSSTPLWPTQVHNHVGTHFPSK